MSTDEHLANLFEAIKLNPDEAALHVNLCDVYFSAAPAERAFIRMMVIATPDLCRRLERWVPEVKDDDPGRYLELRLAALSIRDGRPDARDSLLSLATDWLFAEGQGIDPAPYFRAAGQLSNQDGPHSAGKLIEGMLLPERRATLLEDARKLLSGGDPQ